MRTIDPLSATKPASEDVLEHPAAGTPRRQRQLTRVTRAMASFASRASCAMLLCGLAAGDFFVGSAKSFDATKRTCGTVERMFLQGSHVLL